MKESKQSLEVAIQRIAKCVRTETTSTKMLNSISKIAIELLACENCTIWIYEKGKEKIILRGAFGRHEKGIDEYNYEEGKGLHWYVFKNARSLNVDKSTDLFGIYRGKYVAEIFPKRVKDEVAFLGIPIIFESKCLGVISFSSEDRKRKYSESDQTYAQIVADEIAIALYAFKPHFTNQYHRSLVTMRPTFLAEFGKALLNCEELDEVYDKTTDKIKERISCRTCSIFLFDENGEVKRKFLKGFQDNESLETEIYARGESITGSTTGDPTSHGEGKIENNFGEYLNSIKDADERKKVSRYKKNFERKINSELYLDELVTHVITIPLDGKERTFGVIRAINKINPETNKLSNLGFTQFDKDELLGISISVSIAVASIKKHKKYVAINKVNEFISSNKTDTIFRTLAQEVISNSVSYHACIIRTLDQTKSKLIATGYPDWANKDEMCEIEPGVGILGKAFLETKSYIKGDINDIPENELSSNELNWPKRNGLISLICLPLKSLQGTNFGTLSVYTKFEYIFDYYDKKYLENYAKQISNVIQVIQETRQLSLINELSSQIYLQNDLNEILKTAIREIPRITKFDRCSVALKKANRIEVIENYDGTTPIFETLRLDIDILKQVSKDHKTVISPDFQNDDRFDDVKMKYSNVKSMILIPIISSKNEEIKGALILIMEKAKNNGFSKLVEFSGSEQDLLCALANQISIAIDWTRTFESLKERNFRGEVLREMIHDISSDDDLEENMRIILEKTILALKGEVGYVSLLTNYSEKINHEIVFGMRKQNVPELRIGETGITAIVYLSKKLYSWPKCYIIDELHEPYISLNDRIKSELIAPLLYNKRVIGFITIGKNEESGFKKSDEIFIQSVADNSALIIQKKQFQIATKALSELRFPEMDKGSICNTLAAKAAEIMRSPVSWVRLIDSESEDRTLHIHGWYGKGLSDVGKIKDPETLKHLESEQSVSWGAIQKAEEILSSTSKEGDDEILTLEKLGEDIISLDITQASNVPGRCKPFLERNELCSMLTMPMISGNNVIGVVNVYARRRYGFYDEEKLLLFNLAKSGAIALKKAELMEHTVFLKSEIERFGTTSNIGIAALGFVHDAGIAMHKVNMLISATVDIIPNEIVKVGMGKTITDDLISESTKLRTVFKSLINYGYSKDIIFRSVKIFEVINVAKRMMEIRLKERNINCFIKFGKGANKKLKIDCDKDQLFHVFINLFNNAIESLDKSKTERKNIVIKISDRDRGNINIHFEDNGIGILKEDKKKVFKLHYSTKKHGTGYGLTICKNVIEDFHDGEISVESNPIKSKTTFTIVLPKKQKLKKRKRNDIEITT